MSDFPSQPVLSAVKLVSQKDTEEIHATTESANTQGISPLNA